MLLSACGTRSSLTTPGVGTECGPWSVRGGAAGASRSAGARFAALDDGSVVLAMQDFSAGPGGGGSSSGGSLTHWVRKLDADGDTAWDLVSGPFTLQINGAARDAAGEVVVMGSMPSGERSILGATLSCAAGVCAFLAKIDEAGKLTWSKVISAQGEVFTGLAPSDFAVTGDGRITIEGAFGGTVDFGCGPVTAVGAGYESRYLAQLSPEGECLWSRAIIGTPRLINAPDDVAVDDAGEVAVVLPLETTLGAQTIDLGAGPVPFSTDPKEGPGFAVAKYAPNGDLVFGKVVIGKTSGYTASIEQARIALTSAGEVILSSGYEGPIDFGGGPRGSLGTVRQFVTKLSAKGDELWTRDLATGKLTETGVSAPFALAVDAGGDIFLAHAGQHGLTILDEPKGKKTVVVAAYDADGKPFDTLTFPFTERAAVSGISTSAEGALVLGGHFEGTLDFGQDPLVAPDEGDTFVARICR
ncbi:MAG: hypothetical protein QM820_38135 [Minicystis sp.]